MKYSVITFGCRVNQADSLGFEEDLLARGGEASRVEEADLVVVNTCSVTASADQAARQAIRRVARLNSHAKIVVTGCLATRRPEDVRALPQVVAVVANDDKHRLLSFIQRPERFGQSAAASAGATAPRAALDDAGPLTTTSVRFGDGEGSCGAAVQPGVAGRTAFTLRMQTGCAETCSYCIIPMTRGTPRSVAVDQLLLEVRRIMALGFKEIALTGVHLGSYGRDLEPASSLLECLTVLAAANVRDLGPPDSCTPAGRADVPAAPGVRFRVSSLEPMDCAPAVVDLVASSPVFAPHFHLPLQHASDRMLALMNRPYTLAHYASLVRDIRVRIPSASIGSDVIVGFPGEADDDFERLAVFLESSPLTHLHVFPYSDRPGTAAALLPERVHGTVVRERARRLREISEQLSRHFRDSQVGTVHRALTIEDGSIAVTGNYLKVRIPSGLQRNQWADVRIIQADPLRGEVVAG